MRADVTRELDGLNPPFLLTFACWHSVFEPRLKIGGFGFSKSAAMDSMAKTAVGARGYMAPEVSQPPHLVKHKLMSMRQLVVL